MTEKSEKYRLINFWATWCGPCVTEFSALTETDKMYRNRDFEFISISIDDAKSRNKVTEFLKRNTPPIKIIYTEISINMS